MNDNNKIRWFLKQINILINESIINNQSAKKLEDYYKRRLIEIKKKSGDYFIKVLKFSLLMLAALSIVGGIALVLINFNWQLLSKYLKTILSFLILVIPQTICAYILVKKRDNIILKEVFSLVLSIMFGLSIAFIAQIYQISSSEEIFIFTWAVSTLIILYIFNSVTSLAFYLLLIISLTTLMQIKGTIGLVFYPMFIMLFPFYIIEYRKKVTARIKTIDYFMIISLVITLGISLEKNIPGLWIVAYSSLFVIFYLFGIIFEVNEGNYFSSFKKLVLSPYKIAGVIGTSVISYMLIFNYFWEDIGWVFFRDQSRFNQIASVFDYSIAVLLPLIILILIFFALKRKKSFNYPLVSFAFLAIALYVINCFLIKKFKDLPDYNNALIVFFIMILTAFSFYTGYKNRSKLIIFLNMAFFYIVLYSYFVQWIYYEDFNILMNMIFHGYFGVLLYLTGVLIFNDMEKNKNKLSYFFKFIGIAGIALLSYFMTFDFFWYMPENIKLFFEGINSIFTFSINIFIFLLNILLLFLIIINKKIFNHLIAVFGLFFHLTVLSGLVFRNFDHIKETSSLIMIAYIFILCVYSFYYGYKNKSSLTILLSSIFLFVLIITRFFYSEISVIINGLILIAIGLLLVFINFYFIKKIKKG
ncbi:MAG: DUF2157 domain-containing protein [Spirochaetes bacterium]|nr:DUF2157 domain-containing protein [Spirochaetota bacterium]